MRGINVSGSNLIKMPVLVNVFENAGFESVKTYIQSGNVLFQHHASECEALAEIIRNSISKELNFNVPVIVMEAAALLKIEQNNPFVTERKENTSLLHVTFLSEKPNLEKWEKIDPEKYLPDEFSCPEKAIYLFCPTGYGKTKLNNNFFESKLKVTATTRNWKTVSELVKLAKSC